jgi:hypothetical protein
MQQQQVRAAFSSLDIFLTPDVGHVGRKMQCILKFKKI